VLPISGQAALFALASTMPSGGRSARRRAAVFLSMMPTAKKLALSKLFKVFIVSAPQFRHIEPFVFRIFVVKMKVVCRPALDALSAEDAKAFGTPRVIPT
jgi:hypothetical protein